MNLVDSCGWLEYFADGPNAEFFARPIEDINALWVPTICISEVFKTVMRQRGERAALQAITQMQQGRVVELDISIAVNAAKIAADLKLPLADSIVLATAYAHRAAVWTQDSDFKGIAGVKYKAKRTA